MDERHHVQDFVITIFERFNGDFTLLEWNTRDDHSHKLVRNLTDNLPCDHGEPTIAMKGSPTEDIAIGGGDDDVWAIYRNGQRVTFGIKISIPCRVLDDGTRPYWGLRQRADWG